MHVVAHQPGPTSVTLWVQTEQSETGWTVEVVGGGTAVAPIREESGDPDRLPNSLPTQPDIRIWRHQLKNLVPGAEYTVWVTAPFVDEPTVAATFRTLPDSLDEPFTVLLASCYSEDSDLTIPVGHGLPGRVFRALTRKIRRGYVTTRSALTKEIVGAAPRGNVSRRYQLLCGDDGHGQPDLKILTGDQVYLDTPLVLPMPNWAIRRRISRNYSRTWDKLGFFLSHGANICASDDHEYWNNFPYRPPLVTNLLGLRGQGEREEWTRTARGFVEQVQLAQPIVTFDVGEDLSFCVADTRINRDPAGSPPSGGPPKFMADEEFDRMLSWIRGLSAPGVLVVGQPLLTTTNPADRGLPDFPGQYAELCRALVAAPHDVVVLTGDVHFGRVARAELERADGRRPTRLYEVVSSPMALITLFDGRVGLAPGHFRADISVFPFSEDGAAPEGSGVSQGGGLAPELAQVLDNVRYAPPVRSSGGRCEDHYMTLRFGKLADNAGISVQVDAHLLRIPSGTVPALLQPMDHFVLDAPR